MDNQDILFALGVTMLAGLSTGIGSLVGFVSKKFNPKFLAGALGISAGVMIYVSLVEIFTKAKNSLSQVIDPKSAYGITVVSFFVGIALIALIDRLIPSYENPHEVKNIHDIEEGKHTSKNKLMRMGVFSALAIAIHNFPEGLATFMAALADPKLGISIAVAIAIHNIPEGVAVSAPIYYSTQSKTKAFILSTSSGFAEPVGALIGYFLFRSFFNEMTAGIIFAAVAGIMVYISLDELLPTAREYGKPHQVIYGVIAGMMVMAVSLMLL
jgi:ZIP family zinc transporter